MANERYVQIVVPEGDCILACSACNKELPFNRAMQAHGPLACEHLNAAADSGPDALQLAITTWRVKGILNRSEKGQG